MNKIKQTILHAREQLGWQGTSGIALLLLAGGFNLVALHPLEQETSYIHSRVDVARSKAAIMGGNATSGNRQEELSSFFSSLPTEKDVTDILAEIYATAQASGVQLKEGSYHLENANSPRVEYTMDFPVSGEYAQIRLFVFHVLAHLPAVSLDQIDFQRDRVGDATLKADVRMTLFLNPSK